MADRRKRVSLASRLGDRGKPSSASKLKPRNGSIKSRLSLNTSSSYSSGSQQTTGGRNLQSNSQRERGRLDYSGLNGAGQRKSLSSGMRSQSVLSRNAKKDSTKKKLIQTDKNGKPVQIFTKHFDARNKLKSKQPIPQNRQKLKETTKKAILETRQQNKFNTVMKRRVPASEPQHTQPPKKPRNDTRKPIFTGKSIKVIAKLGKPSNQSASHFPGKYNSPASAVATRLIQQHTGSLSQDLIHRQQPTSELSPYQVSSEGIFAKERPLAALPTRRASDRSPGYAAGNNSVGLHYRAPSTNKQKKHYKVVITNLHPDVTEEDINVLFSAVGDVAQAKLLRPGMAEVVYASLDLASAAHEKYHSRNLDGQPMLCKVLPCHQDDLPSNNDGYSHQYQHQQPTRRGGQPSSNQRRTDSNGQPVIFTVKI